MKPGLRRIFGGLSAGLIVLTAAGCQSPEPAEAGAAQVPPPAAAADPVAPVGAADTQDWQTIATSVQGRPIRARTVGHGPRKVLFIGGIHGDEPEGSVTTAQLPQALEAAGLADAVTLTIIEDANPDGRAAHTRGNADGVDVNRNFPASNFDSANGTPLSEPESRAVHDAIERVQPALIVVAHSWSGDEFINFDGPAREIAERFSAGTGLRVQESSSFAPTPGSLGSYAGRDRGIPLLTVEVLKGTDPQAVWERVREALLQAIGG